MTPETAYALIHWIYLLCLYVATNNDYTDQEAYEGVEGEPLIFTAPTPLGGLGRYDD